jgi:predicted metalloprotease with PDZ domain
MRLLLISLMALISQSLGGAWAQSETTYTISFDNAAHHEAEISVTFKQVKSGLFEARMSRSSPGRYALHEYAKNVYNVSAVNSKGKVLTISKPNPYVWNVVGHDGEVTITYTLFADRINGTYAQFDRTHANMNMPAVFMWSKAHTNTPINITFKPLYDNWKAATQLQKTSNPYRFKAPNLAYFLDSPTELSDHGVRSWVVKSNGKSYTINLAVHHGGTGADLDKYAAKAKAVVDAQIKVFGELPDFDYGEYVFIACYNPHHGGAGMEHRNSTLLASPTSLDEANFSQLGTLSHEFFHIWNVERIRPKELEPFDFTQSNMTPSLWLSEGFTSYYGALLVRRSGDNSVKDYLKTVSTIVNQANSAPGRKYKSPEGMSMMATFSDGGTAIDRTNFRNVFFSYYSYGRMVGMALDLTLRANYPGQSLDTYMALMWEDFGKPEVPFTRDDVRTTLGKLVGDQGFANTFFANHIAGQADIDFESLLKPAGLVVKRLKIKKPYLGPVRFSFKGEAAIIASPILVNSPLYNAGLDRGDRIVKLGRRTIRSNRGWERAVAKYKVGDTVTIKYFSRGKTYAQNITFIGNPTVSVQKLADKKMSKDQKAFLTSWLGKDKKK